MPSQGLIQTTGVSGKQVAFPVRSAAHLEQPRTDSPVEVAHHTGLPERLVHLAGPHTGSVLLAFQAPHRTGSAVPQAFQGPHHKDSVVLLAFQVLLRIQLAELHRMGSVVHQASQGPHQTQLEAHRTGSVVLAFQGLRHIHPAVQAAHRRDSAVPQAFQVLRRTQLQGHRTDLLEHPAQAAARHTRAAVQEVQRRIHLAARRAPLHTAACHRTGSADPGTLEWGNPGAGTPADTPGDMAQDFEGLSGRIAGTQGIQGTAAADIPDIAAGTGPGTRLVSEPGSLGTAAAGTGRSCRGTALEMK